METWAWESRPAIDSFFGLIRPPTPRMAVGPVRLGCASSVVPGKGAPRTCRLELSSAVLSVFNFVSISKSLWPKNSDRSYELCGSLLYISTRAPVRDGYAARGGRCGPPRGADSRRVFGNRFTRSNKCHGLETPMQFIGFTAITPLP